MAIKRVIMEIIKIREFENFEDLKAFCESLEARGYVLNVRDCCYERAI